ncbi:MAG: hypothetical protein IPJ64_09930 [Saprospiraceae bacterium]|nr:hypothetical protein [Saprospiraceae bacterium]MBK7796670.1 hypothetical protein [Saprospiraceae bacterium]
MLIRIIISYLIILLICNNTNGQISDIKIDSLTIKDAIFQLLCYPYKDIIWHGQQKMYNYKTIIPANIYNQQQEDKYEFIKKDLKKKRIKIIETIDTIEKWTVYVADSAKFAQNTNMMKSESKDNENFVFEDTEDKNNYSQATIWFSKVNQFFIDFPQGNDEFQTPYDNIYWYPKAKFPIEMTHKGILDTIGFEFKFEIPMFFHNNYPAMLQFYHCYYGLWIDRSFERRKRIHVFQRN